MRKYLQLLLLILLLQINCTAQCFRQIVAGGNHCLAIKTDGTLWTWGENSVGQLGNGTTAATTNPIKIGSDTDWAYITAGVSGNHSIAIKNNGTLWAWGYNFYGQLGNGTGTNLLVPTQIGTDTNWATAAAGLFFTIALKTDGTLWAWGRNDSSQLGIGSNLAPNDKKLVPTQVTTTIGSWVKIVAGDAHCLGIQTDGSLWAWGYNFFGQLGNGLNGNNTNKNTPTLISSLNWTDIAAGDSHSLAVKSDGTLYSTGNNLDFQLGQGTSGPGTNTNTFIQIGAATDWTKVGCGEFHSFALKTTGTLYAWGNNPTGQLGIGTNGPDTDVNTPTQVGTQNKWENVGGGRGHTVGISRAELYTWGRNLNGQLGNGNTGDAFNLNIPTQINCGVGFATWAGTADTDWLNSANWQFNQLPNINSLVTIQSGAINYPILTTSTTIKNLRIHSGGLLTVTNNAEFSVNGQ
jgi:alpha-tubulin suppressor-like RCC1 family protein